MNNDIESINGELVDVATGEVLGQDCPISEKPETNIDDLISAFEFYKNLENENRERRINIELQLAAIAESISGEGKTRRVAGKERTVKVTFKTTDKWNQEKLEDLRKTQGDDEFFRFFRVTEYKPNTKEIQKLKNTAGEPEKLYHEICKAMMTVGGKPSVEIEK